MKSELILESFLKKEIQLTTFEKLIHFSFPIIVFAVALICFSTLEKENLNLDNSAFKMGLFLLFISLITFINQKLKLKLNSVHLKNIEKNIAKEIAMIVEKNKWKIQFENKNTFIIETTRPFSAGKYFFSKSLGEIIYVFIKPNEILFKSVYDKNKNFGIVISSGENNENERKIKAIC